MTGLFVGAAGAKAGDLLAEYGGRLWHWRTADGLWDLGRGSHLRTLGFKYRVLDARIDEVFTVRYFVAARQVASFANTHPDLREGSNNAYYKNIPCTKGYMPYPGADCLSCRCFLVAKHDMEPYTEIFAYYGDHHCKVIFNERQARIAAGKW